jgi:hypothetical protein
MALNTTASLATARQTCELYLPALHAVSVPCQGSEFQPTLLTPITCNPTWVLCRLVAQALNDASVLLGPSLAGNTHNLPGEGGDHIVPAVAPPGMAWGYCAMFGRWQPLLAGWPSARNGFRTSSSPRGPGANAWISPLTSSEHPRAERQRHARRLPAHNKSTPPPHRSNPYLDTQHARE